MPTISGNVLYSPNNTLTPNSGIANVPVVLRDATSQIGAVALTDTNGEFVFTNVPNGSYQVIEAWGMAGGTLTPVNYLTSQISMPIMPSEVDPPLSALSVVPPALADKLMSISPNLLNINVSGDISSLAFYDAPVGDKPIVFNGLQMVGPNLITVVDNGSFGTLPAGSPVNTIPAVAPYPSATPGLPYQANPEITDGHYSIVNIRRRVNTAFAWWNISDHETMLEKGRLMFVNGDNPGAVLLTETVAVTPNTFYTLTGWGGNLLNIDGTPPRFSVKVTAIDGTVIGYQLLNSINYTPIPVWYQAGFLFNSGDYNAVKVEIISEAPFSVTGNDYVIDELRLFRTEIIELLEVQKSFAPDKLYAATSAVGQTSTITAVVTNTSTFIAPNVFFQDSVDPQLQFVPGSVLVNGSNVGFATADPNVGFSLGNMAAGAVNTVSFTVKSLVPGEVVIPNTANATYDAATNGNGDIIKYTVASNVANLEIILNRAVVNVTKSTDKPFADINDVITYTLTLTNSGNVAANNVVISDNVPSGTTYINGSLFGATGAPPIMTVATIPAGGTAIVTYQVLVGNTIPNPNPVLNSAKADYAFTIDPANPNGGSSTADSNIVETLVNSATITTVKSVDKTFADVGEIVTYTLMVTNSGNVPANNVVVTDALSPGLTFIPGSLVNATGTPPTLTLNNPVAAGASVLVKFKAKVNSAALSATPILNNAKAAFTYTVDPAKPNGESGNSYSNTVSTAVNSAKLVSTKTVDKNISYLNDILTYSIALTNNGNTSANNASITDLLNSGLTYVPGSISVSAPFSGTPDTTITLTNPINVGSTVVITFQAKVTSMPIPNPAINSAAAAYNYTVDPSKPNGTSGLSKTNIVKTLVFRNNYGQQITDLIESVALEQAAMAAIMNAEGAKIQKMVAMGNVTTQELLCLNKSVAAMAESLAILESILKQKMKLVDCQINGSDGANC